MQIVKVIVLFALIGCAFGQGLQGSLVGSWQWPAAIFENHNVGDTHFCGDSEGNFWGTAGRIFQFQGTHVNGQTASGIYQGAGTDIEGRGRFEIALTNGSGGQKINVTLTPGDAPFEDARDSPRSSATFQLTRLANGGVMPSERQCFTQTRTGEDATKGVSGTWVGGANPRLERGPSGTYAICVDETTGVVHGSYDNLGNRGYIVGQTVSDASSNTVAGVTVYGRWYEQNPGAGDDVTGDLLLSAISRSHINGFKWNLQAFRFWGAYNGDMTLTRSSELGDNLDDLQRRCERNADVFENFSGASTLSIAVALLLIQALFVVLF